MHNLSKWSDTLKNLAANAAGFLKCLLLFLDIVHERIKSNLLKYETVDYVNFYFYTGAVSERISLSVYMIFAFLNTGLIYVFPAHWVWNRDGWLKQLGALDFAGSSVVHMSGGIAALVAAKILGPRNERFGNKCNEYKMSNPIFILLGTLLLTLGWFGFNCGSTLALSRGELKFPINFHHRVKSLKSLVLTHNIQSEIHPSVNFTPVLRTKTKFHFLRRG